MAPAPYILARSMKEAHDFAQNELGLDRGRYRLVMSAGTIKAVYGIDLYLVPGWETRFDRFAIRTALRYARGVNQIDVEKWREENDPSDGLEPRGEQLALTDSEPTDECGPLLEPENYEKPARRRRRKRCGDCGSLVDPEDFDQHVADHLPVVV